MRTAAILCAAVLGCEAERAHVPDAGPRCPDGAPPPFPAPRGRPARGGSITVRLVRDPGTLQHMLLGYRMQVVTTAVMLHDVSECLVRWNPKTRRLEPELAESWRVERDGTRYVFSLRKGVTWHDGAPFSSADVVYTFDRLFDPLVLVPQVRMWSAIVEKWSAPDAATIVIDFHRPWADALLYLEWLPIVARHQFADAAFERHPGQEAPLGTGPYVIARHLREREILLRRNEGYWGRPGYLDEIRYRFIGDDAEALRAFWRGEVDVDTRLPPGISEERAFPPDRTEDRVWVVPDPWPGFRAIAWRTDRPPFDDKRVRQAMTLLLDRPRLRGRGRCKLTPLATPFPRAHPAYLASLEPWPFDAARAATLLDEAGYRSWDGEGIRRRQARDARTSLRFRLLVRDEFWRMRVAARFQQDLRRAGVRMEIEAETATRYHERTASGDFDAVDFDWPLSEPSVDLEPILGRGPGNLSRFVVPLVSEIGRTRDGARRLESEQALQRLLHDEQPFTLVDDRPVRWLVSRRVHGVFPASPGLIERELWVRSGAR